MDIRIIQVIRDVFEENGEVIRYDFEQLEIALSDKDNKLVDESYLFVLANKTHVFEAIIFDDDFHKEYYIKYLIDVLSLSEEESVFTVSICQNVIGERGYFFEIPHIKELFEDALKRQDRGQLYTLLRAYFYGFGVKQDYAVAFEIATVLESYDQGDSDYYLGYMYEQGLGVEQDRDKAMTYYLESYSSLSLLRLGLMSWLGEGDTQAAKEYFSKSDEGEAHLYLGLILEEERDYSGAFQSYSQGALVYQTECLYKAAYCLQNAIGTLRDYEKAKTYYTYAYYFLHPLSTYQLGMMLLEGIKDDKDISKGIRYLTQAAYIGSVEACKALARYYEVGQYVEKNEQQALYYYRRLKEIEEGISNEGIS